MTDDSVTNLYNNRHLQYKKKHTFTGELFEETLIIKRKENEHVGLKSYDGWFEKLFNKTAEKKQLPQKVKITIKID